MEPISNRFSRDKQIEIQRKCHHPDGTWTPFNWADPMITFPERITQLAEEHPDRVALIDHDTSMTFAELDQAANAVAAAILEARGLGQEPVALLVGFDVPAVVGALGIMKAGKFFVSLEETFPLNFHQYILDDTGAKLLLMDAANVDRASDLMADNLIRIQLEDLPANAPPPQIEPPTLDDLALINFTSGTTGQPKGVVQSHRSAIALSVRFMSTYHPSDVDITATFQYLAWAGSYWVLFGTLMPGSSCAIFDVRRYGIGALIAWIHKVKPTIVVGQVFIRELARKNPDEAFSSVRLIATGGDAIFKADMDGFKRNYPEAVRTIGLGISEAGMTTQVFFDRDTPIEEEVMPLGYPVEGLKIHLLSENGEKVQPGEIGEIVVESPHLAVGYWNKPDLTKEKFQLASHHDNLRAYHTGDLGVIRSDGMLQHMGRAHDMIKIRGLQVFPKKIEALLIGVPGVKSVCVTGYTPPESQMRLVGYLVVNREVFPGLDALYTKLADQPNHMKPQNWVFIDEMPLTSTGKIDRKRLPIPEFSRLNLTAEYLAPRTVLEESLAEIWGETLGIDDIGVDDDFFELGGDSMIFTRIISKVRESLNVNLTFNDAFAIGTVAEMGTIIHGLLDEED